MAITLVFGKFFAIAQWKATNHLQVGQIFSMLAVDSFPQLLQETRRF
jgi:hypothetical protein